MQKRAPIRRIGSVLEMRTWEAIYEACGRAPLAVIANHTSRIPEHQGRNAPHLVDTLLSLGMDIRRVFAPEHGFRGDAHNGAHIDDEHDAETGLALISLHGKLRKPTPEMLADVRMLLFDIQDVGARFYTYLSTLFLAMEAAAETGNCPGRSGPTQPPWTSTGRSCIGTAMDFVCRPNTRPHIARHDLG